MSDLFDIDTTTQVSPIKTRIKKPQIISSAFPSKLTGELILKKRLDMKCSKKHFAESIGVSITTITLWEDKNKDELKLNSTSMNKLKKMWEEKI